MTLFDLVAKWLPFDVFRRVSQRLELPISSYRGLCLKPLEPSTLTLCGDFANWRVDEIGWLNEPHPFEPDVRIVTIGSNYGEKALAGYIPPEKKPKTKSNRGRKPKPPKVKKRILGNGRYLNTQITFVIKSSLIPGKVYKTKVFRNGVYQIPGVLCADFADAVEPLAYFTQYFNRYRLLRT